MLYYSAFLILTYLISRSIQTDDSELYRNRMVRFGAVLMLLLMGMRHSTIFGDAVVYAGTYEHHIITWPGFYTLFTTEREPLFTLLEYVCQRITTNYTFFFFVTSIPIVIGFYRLVRKESQDMFISVLLYCALGCFYFSMAGIRQAVAMGITMIAYSYAKERRLIPFLICCLLAYGFHNSSIVFVLVYFVVNWTPGWKMWIAVAISVFLGVTKNPIVIQLANIFTTKEYEMDVTGLNYTMLMIQVIFLAFCFIYGYLSNREEEKKNNYQSYLLLGFIGAIFQSFSPIKGEFFRISLYFSVYLTIAVPNIISNIDNERNQIFIRVAVIIALLSYILLFTGAGSYRPCFA